MQGLWSGRPWDSRTRRGGQAEARSPPLRALLLCLDPVPPNPVGLPWVPLLTLGAWAPGLCLATQEQGGWELGIPCGGKC